MPTIRPAAYIGGQWLPYYSRERSQPVDLSGNQTEPREHAKSCDCAECREAEAHA